jgi:26S proteasome regulatory subunit T4
MDEIDAIGGRRFSEGTSADREIQRTLMELLNQLDGFDELGKVHFIPVKCARVMTASSAIVKYTSTL